MPPLPPLAEFLPEAFVPLGLHAEAVTVPASDGVKLRAGHWRAGVAKDAAQGTILILQGRAEFVEKYASVIAEFGRYGFSSATFDWRGQGGSERLIAHPRKGHIRSFGAYLRDLAAILDWMRANDLAKPWYLVAHSMGGAVALQAIIGKEASFRRAVLCAPLIEVAGIGPGHIARDAARVLARMGFAEAFVPRGSARSPLEGLFAGNPLMQDRERFFALQAMIAERPRLAIGDPTIGWATAMFDALDAFAKPEFGAKNETPILMLLAGQDRIVDSAAAARLATRIRSASAIVIPGARHELLQERAAVRAQVTAAILSFFGAKADAPV
jgi:lysophospholipase